MTRILLIRHGTTDLLGRVLYGRTPGIFLNAEGRIQADKLAAALMTRYTLSKIVSSPLERAVQTAEPIASSARIAITLDDGITEIDSGSWTGKTFSDLSTLDEWQRYNRRRSLTRPPGGETMMNVQSRSWQALQRMIGDSDSNTIAVVSHGDVIRGLLLLFLGMSIDHIHRLEIAPASMTDVAIGPYGPIVNCVNQIFY
ncbi:MAG: histidine phosphatase family protein [Acidobacteriaceae bacterium]|nr:histidine phosphatase family protein [Acidobacteriaceae bacterium]MBV9500086.1 histidine phosphatase family protein [Acidobacteriaceae bacterium]